MGKNKNRAETPEEKANRELVEGIARNLEALAGSIRSLVGGRLKKKAIVVLLAQSAQIPQNKVEAVLDALTNLDKEFVN